MAAAVPATAVVRRTHSPEQTESLAAALGPSLATGDLVLLEGPLGAGKTRFVTGLARGMNARGRVRSPSYTLVNEYSLDGRKLYHLDLYRLESADPQGLGLDEMLERGVVVVEWGDRLPESSGQEALVLAFALDGESDRSIAARARGARGGELVEIWRRVLPGGPE